MSRGFLATVTAACVVFASCALMGPARAEQTVENIKSTSDRMGGGGGHSAKVKGSKSNSSERMGGGGGVRGGSGAPAKAINLNSSRSNNY